MVEQIMIILLIGTICFNHTLARPDLLKQQRYEFHTISSHDQIASFPKNSRLEVAPDPVQHDYILWSQQHQNEVNAFAEMFRQNYNQMIEQHNKMIHMHHHVWTNPFMPVTYELYYVPDEVIWKNYFGNQQQYIHEQTKELARQLIQNLEQGRVSPEDLKNPNFFITQAANELNRIHQVQNEFETNGKQISSSFGDTYQQHQFDAINVQQQQQHAEGTIYQETEGTDQVLVYNHKTGEYQYATVVAAPEVPLQEESVRAMVSNGNVHHPSYIQRLPPVSFNNGMLNKFSQEVDTFEVHTPVSVETRGLTQQGFNEEVKVSTHKPVESIEDQFYSSTYDQQPIYDLRFVQSASSTARSSMVNVISLVRNKTKVKTSTTTTELSTTSELYTTSEPSSTTTTELPTTESSIMSMLPNKKPSLNYTDIYHKVRAELNRQMKQLSDNISEEAHFMGMTSNIDHAKLSYETVADGKDHTESRGDQPIKSYDHIYEEYVESEPTTTYYSVDTEPALVVPNTAVKPSSTPSPILSTPKPIRAYQNTFYTAPLAPFPTTTIKSLNPYYSAPLAPFPDDMFQVTQNTTQSQKEHFEPYDMRLETEVIDHPYASQFILADTIPESNEQQYDELILDNSEFQISHDVQQYENVQQRYFDMASDNNLEGQMYEKQLPPEQTYRNPDLQTFVGGFDHNSDIPAHVKEITETPGPIDNKTQKNNWFHRQYSKLKNVF